MNKLTRMTLVAALGVMLPFLLNAQNRFNQRGSGGWSCCNQDSYAMIYNTGTETTIQAEVLAVELFTPRKGMSAGVHLMVLKDEEELSVHLGPEWFMERQDAKFEKGDKVEITGALITFDGKPALIAKSVLKGENELVLRNDSGFPLWSGWRKANRRFN